MNRLIFFLFYIGINFFRIIPFAFLNVMSWIVYVIIFYIVGYRKKVVIDNLTKSFPEKSEKEILAICKEFYKDNLSSIFTEGLKGFTMSNIQFLNRYKVLNPEILDEYFEKEQDVIALASHYGNWEWGVQAVNQQIKHQAAALYKPMSNVFIERYAKKLRQKFGMQLVPITETRAYFEKVKPLPVVYIMAADQNPSNTEKAYWTNFLGRDTACLHGPENYAKFNKLPLIFFDVKRIKRGYYTMEIKKLVDDPTKQATGEITQKYMTELERAIKQSPANWLWSHKRWKNSRNNK